MTTTASKKLKRVRLQPQFAGLAVQANHYAFWSGRAGGKSYAICDWLLLQGIQRPCVILCLREIQTAIKKSVHRLMEQRIEAHHGWSSHYTVQREHIVGRNGTIVWFLGLNGRTRDNLRSIEGVTHCYVTEAHDISAKSLDVMLPSIRSDGCQFYWDWNPQSPKDPVDAMFRDQDNLDALLDAGMSVVLPHPDYPITWETNAYLSREAQMQATAKRLRDPEGYEHDYGGGYQRRTDRLIFRRGRDWDTEDYSTINVERLPAYYGADFGFTHPTVLVQVLVDRPNKILHIKRLSYKVRWPTEKIPAAWNPVVRGKQDAVIRADSASPRLIQDLQKLGFKNLQGAAKGKDSINEGLAYLQEWKIAVDERACPELVEELENYGWKVNQHTDEITDQIEDKWNHVIDAIRYAIEPLRERSGIRVARSRSN